MLPGDPFQSEKAIPPKVKENLMAKYHLDRPLGEQYVEYLKNIAKGDLGASMKVRGRTVNDVIKKSFLTSADLGARSIIFALALGIPLGIIAALKRGKYQDRLAMIVAIIGISVPSFVLAGLMQKYVVDIHNGTLIRNGFLPDFFWINLSGWDTFDKKILPVIALGLYTVALIARLLRDKMIEVMGQDYIRPVLTGSFVIEKMFSIPGLGKYFVDSINDRDYTMVLGVTVFYAVFLIIMMILVDIVYVLVDPKIKLGKGDEV